MPWARYLNVVEAVIVDRYGPATVERWLDDALPTPDEWGTGAQAAAEQQQFMSMIGAG